MIQVRMSLERESAAVHAPNVNKTTSQVDAPSGNSVRNKSGAAPSRTDTPRPKKGVPYREISKNAGNQK